MKRTYLYGLLGISLAAALEGCTIDGIPKSACFPEEPCAQKYDSKNQSSETDVFPLLDTALNDSDALVSNDAPFLSDEEKAEDASKDVSVSEDVLFSEEDSLAIEEISKDTSEPLSDIEKDVSVDGKEDMDVPLQSDQGMDLDADKDAEDTSVLADSDDVFTGIDANKSDVTVPLDSSTDSSVDSSLDTLVLPTGPCLATYLFDGDFTNECANGPLAQNYGAVFTPSKEGLGQAVSFDGTAKIVFPIYNAGGKFTYSVYIKPADAVKSFDGTYGTILAAKTDAGEEVYALRIGDNNILKAKLAQTTLAAIVPDLLPSKDLQKITVEYNGSQILLYVNDTLQASKDVTYSGQKGNVLVSLGSDNQTESIVGNNFKGTLDEVVIMNDE